MIERLAGLLLEKSPPQVVIEIHGVGYEVDVPMTTFYQLPAVGEKTVLYTHLLIREDAHLLFGFASQTERTTFRQLIKISGIGARIALAILSGMSADELAHAIASEDIKRLTAVPGIGKKTAQRLVLELRDKLTSHDAQKISDGLRLDIDHGTRNVVRNALLALGYSDKEATLALKSMPKDVGVSEGIRQALKSLAKI